MEPKGSSNVHLFISVMGTLGSGKTTAAKLLASHFGFELIEENFGENAFLPKFYTNQQRWAFHSQTFFLMEKISQMMTIEGRLYTNSVVQDTPIYQDVFGYAKSQNLLGNMNADEWKLYNKIFKSFEPFLPKPDLLVYLGTSVSVTMQRIKGRGRSFEQEIPQSYVATLDAQNRLFLSQNKDIPVLTINTDRLNLVRSRKARSTFIGIIDEALASRFTLIHFAKRSTTIHWS